MLLIRHCVVHRRVSISLSLFTLTSLILTLAPLRRSKATMSSLPCCTAMWSSPSPSVLRWLISKPTYFASRAFSATTPPRPATSNTLSVDEKSIEGRLQPTRVCFFLRLLICPLKAVFLRVKIFLLSNSLCLRLCLLWSLISNDLLVWLRNRALGRSYCTSSYPRLGILALSPCLYLTVKLGLFSSSLSAPPESALLEGGCR